MTSEADVKMEVAISQMLRAGVSVAAVVVFIGGLLYVLQAHGVAPDYRHFHGVRDPADRIPPPLIAHHLDSRNIIRVGILLLIATPIMRVAYCVYSFAMQRDKIYVAVSCVVLTVLLYGFFHQ
jgi:uncharacterized membrane protein